MSAVHSDAVSVNWYTIKFEGEELSVYNPDIHHVDHCFITNYMRCVWLYQHYGTGVGFTMEETMLVSNPHSEAWCLVLQESSHVTLRNDYIDGANYGNGILINDTAVPNLEGAETLKVDNCLIINGKDGVRWQNSDISQNGMSVFVITMLEDLVNAFHVVDASGSRRMAILTGVDTFGNMMDILVEPGEIFYWTLEEVFMDKNKISTNAIIDARGARGMIRSQNSGSTTAANGDWKTHGLWKTPQVVLVDAALATYDGVPVNANCIAMNSTHWQAGLVWSNGTVINDPLTLYWMGKT